MFPPRAETIRTDSMRQNLADSWLNSGNPQPLGISSGEVFCRLAGQAFPSSAPVSQRESESWIPRRQVWNPLIQRVAASAAAPLIRTGDASQLES
jgi:hypothetical protein